MKIISGRFKGKKLTSPNGLFVRPTAGRVREALFDIIREKVEGALFLDLFAGSGAVGLEAYSLGARKVTFVEKNLQAAKILEKNLSYFRERECFEILKLDVWRALRFLYSEKRSYHLIFLDPPYAGNLIAEVLDKIEKFSLLAKRGLVITEGQTRKLDDQYCGQTLQLVDQRDYGKSHLNFYEGL